MQIAKAFDLWFWALYVTLTEPVQEKKAKGNLISVRFIQMRTFLKWRQMLHSALFI